jgi:hypothetical protein
MAPHKMNLDCRRLLSLDRNKPAFFRVEMSTHVSRAKIEAVFVTSDLSG